MQLHTGDTAPSFTLLDQNQQTHSLADYQGKWLLLYFYPTDDTPGCTTEACGFRDNLPKFKDLRAEIVGVSVQDSSSHSRFATKYKLPFTLLADTEKVVVKKYGVWAPKKMFGKEFLGTKRTSFLIDPTGKIAKIYENVRPPKHPQQVLKDLNELLG